MISSFCENVRLTTFTEELFPLYDVLYLINAVSSAISITTNLMVILAIFNCNSLRSPSFIMIFTLGVTDFGVGSIVQPLYIALRLAETNTGESGEHCYLAVVYTVAVISLSGLSFFIMTLISIDRFLAICLCMKYKLVVTTKRTIAVTIVLAMTALAWSVLVIFSKKSRYVFSMFLMPACLFITSFNYLNIIRILKKQQKKFRNFSTSASTAVTATELQVEQTRNKFNGRYKRVLYTMIFIYIAFVLSYLPYLCYLFAVYSMGPSVPIIQARHITATIIFLRSSVSPLLYFWRIKNIRKAIWKLLY